MGDGVVLVIFLLHREGDGYAVPEFEEWIPENLEIVKAEDDGLAFLGLGDFDALTQLHGKEDCHSDELSNGSLQFCAPSLCNLGYNTHGNGFLLLLFWVVIGIQSILSL